jgi:hypothetical protein
VARHKKGSRVTKKNTGLSAKLPHLISYLWPWVYRRAAALEGGGGAGVLGCQALG